MSEHVEEKRSTLSSSLLTNWHSNIWHVIWEFRVLETSRWSALLIICMIGLGFVHIWFESRLCYVEV